MTQPLETLVKRTQAPSLPRVQQAARAMRVFVPSTLRDPPLILRITTTGRILRSA